MGLGDVVRAMFDVVGTFAGVQGADGGDSVVLQVGKTVFHDVPAQVRLLLLGGGQPGTGRNQSGSRAWEHLAGWLG